jgi:hydroxyacylglutathione hydrolase
MNSKPVVIQKYTIGQMGVNCYILYDPKTREALIIDPGDEASYLAEHIARLELGPLAILATHGHFDHVLAARELQLIYNIPFMMCSEDQFLLDRMSKTAEHFLGHTVVEIPPVITKTLTDGDEIEFGSNMLKVMASPGHTPGSVCFYEKSNHTLFAGDTLFEGGAVGRTDFSYSSHKDLIDSIGRIMKFDDDTIVYAGHGKETTVFAERAYTIHI